MSPAGLPPQGPPPQEGFPHPYPDTDTPTDETNPDAATFLSGGNSV